MAEQGLSVVCNGFCLMPNQLLDEAPDKSFCLVYLVVYRHGNGSPQGCWCSHQQISRESGVYLKGVRRALAWLEEHGWLEANRRTGSTTVYRVIVQDPERKRPRSKTTYKQNPYKQDPKNKIPVGRAAPDGAATDRGKRSKVFRPRPEDVPPELGGAAAELLTFWGEKAGSKSQRAWLVLLAELRKIQLHREGGIAVVRQQLQNGTQAGWASCTFSNWERYGRQRVQGITPRGCRADEKSIAELAAEMEAMPVLSFNQQRR
jgi:hypothetical protein